MKKIISILGVLLILGCEPFVTEFPDTSNAVPYETASQSNATYGGGNIKVVTWNIRFGIARFPFFGDSCGDDVILDDDTIEKNMAAIADSLNAMDADIVLLQEVDVSSKRTGYMDQVQYLLDHTNLNYGCYASMWKADFIPSDGIGRINAGNAILSKYELTEAERIQLRLRTDQDGLTQYFYLRRNIIKAKIPELSQGGKDLFAVNIHTTAFATMGRSMILGYLSMASASASSSFKISLKLFSLKSDSFFLTNPLGFNPSFLDKDNISSLFNGVFKYSTLVNSTPLCSRSDTAPLLLPHRGL